MNGSWDIYLLPKFNSCFKSGQARWFVSIYLKKGPDKQKVYRKKPYTLKLKECSKT